MDRTEARRLRPELQTLTQASFTVSTFLHIKQGFVASNQKTREGAGGGTPSTTSSPPQPTSPTNLQVCGWAEGACLWESRFPWREKCPSRRQLKSPLCTVIGLLNISQLLCLLSRGAGYTQCHCYLDYIASWGIRQFSQSFYTQPTDCDVSSTWNPRMHRILPITTCDSSKKTNKHKSNSNQINKATLSSPSLHLFLMYF